MPRLFFALNPDDKVRDRLTKPCLAITGGRCIRPQNFHLTLHFIGQTNAEKCLIDHAENIGFKPFNLIIDQYGYFKRAKVVWAGSKHCPDDLFKLAEHCAETSVKCGNIERSECYTPHISLIRKIDNKPDWPEFEAFEWNVNSFCLMASESGQSGVQYRVIRDFPVHH